MPAPADAARFPGRSGTFYARFGKRAFDIVFSLCALVVLSPLLLVLVVFVAATSESVFFGQKRYGRGKRVFRMWKFETMTSETPREVTTEELKSEDVHFTRYGAFLRKYSLNELPQLANILKGDIPLRILKTRPEFSEESMVRSRFPPNLARTKERCFRRS